MGIWTDILIVVGIIVVLTSALLTLAACMRSSQISREDEEAYKKNEREAIDLPF